GPLSSFQLELRNLALESREGLIFNKRREFALTALEALLLARHRDPALLLERCCQPPREVTGQPLDQFAHVDRDVVPERLRPGRVSGSCGTTVRLRLPRRLMLQGLLQLTFANGNSHRANPVVEALAQLVYRQFLDSQQEQRIGILRHSTTSNGPTGGAVGGTGKAQPGK